MHTFEAVESISEDIFDVLFYDTLYYLNNDFPWSIVGLNINSTNNKKRNAFLEAYKTILNDPNGLIALHKVNDVPQQLLSGVINENYYDISLGIFNADYGQSKANTEYAIRTVEAMNTFLTENSLLGFSGFVTSGSSTHNYANSSNNSISNYYSTYTEESMGFIGFPEREIIKFTVTLD